jgi:hypothetical protein
MAPRSRKRLAIAPALWYKAEQAYREGETFFRERAYGDALKRFAQARIIG